MGPMQYVLQSIQLSGGYLSKGLPQRTQCFYILCCIYTTRAQFAAKPVKKKSPSRSVKDLMHTL